MYGAMIGDIVGSKYEFHNIKTKEFPLFSEGCDYTDDSIMTAAVAKAILLSRMEQYKNSEQGKGFADFLIETMQDFGRRYPNPTGSYGIRFAQWLKQENPEPYGSYGNGSAMRASPCGLAAVTMEEAVALARVSAAVTHDHPEGIKGAEAVAAAIFLAKTGKKKEEIKSYIQEHYYDFNFTLDEIRPTYRFDPSCQGTVPQALEAFFESESFEDAIRNVISIGGDSDTAGAITGSVAWIYYAGYYNWITQQFRGQMEEIRKQAMTYLPQELIDIQNEFIEVCGRRAGTYHRMGGCTMILNKTEWEVYGKNWAITAQPEQESKISTVQITPEMKAQMTAFCNKYVVLLGALYEDQELNQWCRNYSAYCKNTTHCEVERIIYSGLLKDAYALPCMLEIFPAKTKAPYTLETALTGTEADQIYGILLEIRMDYASNGSLIYHSIAEGNLYRLMCAFLKK